jgi:hypothetical protein
VSRRFSLFWVTVSLVVLFLASSAPVATAQAPRGHAVARTGPVVTRSHYYGPYYRPYYYRPYYRPYFYGPYLYSSFFWYPYPYYYAPYGFYGAYYGGYYDPLSSVKVEVKPKDAHVYVDGYFAGEVDRYDGAFQRLRLTPGPHQIEVYLEGYKTLRQTVYLTPDSTFKLRGELAKLAEGQPSDPLPTPKATPDGDRGRGRGYGYGAPHERRRTPPPPEPGTPAPGDDEAVEGRQPQPEAGTRDSQFGTIAVRFQPGDAEVLIDGEVWQGTDRDQRLLVNLPVGSHRVEVRKAGHRPFSTEVDVRPGETTTVNVSLPSDGK